MPPQTSQVVIYIHVSPFFFCFHLKTINTEAYRKQTEPCHMLHNYHLEPKISSLNVLVLNYNALNMNVSAKKLQKLKGFILIFNLEQTKSKL